MNCLLVIAHPLPDSLCQSLAEACRTRLRERGHEVTVTDLCARKFDPVLQAHERRLYYAPAYDSAAVADEIRALQDADMLVLVFPTWWFAMPAVLKGWFDRVWAPGVAYDHAPDLGAIRPRLTKLQTVVAVTTLGAPWWVDRLLMWRPVKRMLELALLHTCAPQARLTMISFYTCEKVSSRRFETMLRTLGRRLDRALSATGPRPLWRKLLP